MNLRGCCTTHSNTAPQIQPIYREVPVRVEYNCETGASGGRTWRERLD